jgi:hypothetical protein
MAVDHDYTFDRRYVREMFTFSHCDQGRKAVMDSIVQWRAAARLHTICTSHPHACVSGPGISVPKLVWNGWIQMRDGCAGRPGALAGLVVLAHWLFFRQSVGISLVIFALCVVGAVVALRGGRVTRWDAGLLGGVVLAALPVVEKVQWVSVMFLVAGVAMGVVGIWSGPALRDRWAIAALRMVGGVAWRGPADVWAVRGRAVPRVTLGHWVMPLAVAGVFAGLMIAGNPVLEAWVVGLTAWKMDGMAAAQRFMFCVLMAMLIWPMLVAGADAGRLTRAHDLPGVVVPMAAFGFTAASVARALVMFNAMFAVQTVLDGTYLWGGAALPDGMSHAAYAHRGAYPLLATALLAGVFALLSRPFLGEGRLLKGLLILWLVQNVMLVVSSLLRLELYVGEYGLTYLRIAAGIWMGLVAAGLALTAWQVWAGRSNGWLIGVNAGLAGALLYLCCFVNFAAFIADDGRARLNAGKRVDMGYLCALGPDAAGHLPMRCGGVEGPVIKGWRDWGFRAARIRGRFDGMTGRGE